MAAHLPLTSLSPPIPPFSINSIGGFHHIRSFKSVSITGCCASPFTISCTGKDRNRSDNLLQGFSILKTDFKCDAANTWSTMGFYVFSLHVPLSFGGPSVVAQLLHQPVLDPVTQASSLLVIETLELLGFILLLRYSGNSFNVLSLFEVKAFPDKRNWLLASVLGLGFLLALVFLTSLLADKLIGSKDVNDPVLKEILSGGPPSAVACTLLYCVVAPFLEETVYRGFLLTSLAATMEWQKAVVVSSAVFSATHLSGESLLQLCVVGVVVGCSYCWTGTLVSPFVIHSLYNAFVLVATFAS